jgi:hypothetical protein
MLVKRHGHSLRHEERVKVKDGWNTGRILTNLKKDGRTGRNWESPEGLRVVNFIPS